MNRWKAGGGGVAGLVVAAALALIGPSVASSAPTLPSADPFYSPPASLAQTAPGTMLRNRTVTVAESGTSTPITATQVLYRTTAELGQPSATVATIIRPAGTASPSKIVSYQTAYDALGSECDPSYTLQGGNSSYSTAQEEQQLILSYVAQGYTVVVPDYEGEHLDWAAGQESGYGTLDGIRAAENFLGLSASSTPVAMVGYSGGSIATDFAAEQAPKYAPELDIVATAEGGVPVDFFHNLTYINGSPDWSGVIPAVLVSLARAFGVSFEQYLSPYGVQVTNQVKDECINSFVGDYPGLTIQKLLKAQYQDYNKLPSLVSIGNQLIMSRTGTPKGPLFIGVGNADGTGDGVMVAKDVQELAYTYCQRGVPVQFNQYGGDDHTNAAVPFEEGALNFINQAMNGLPVANGCSSIAPGNSIAPMAVPPTLKLRYLGAKRHRRGAVVELSSTVGTLQNVVITLQRGHRIIARRRLASLGTSTRRVVLRHRGRMPRRGRYTLKVSEGGATLLMRSVKVS